MGRRIIKKHKRKNCMANVKSVEFTSATSITITAEDGTTQVFTNAPVVTDTEVTVTHADGSTEVFEPKA